MENAIETSRPRRSGTLMLHLVGRCNLRCLHCYMEGSPSRREQLPVELVLEAIAECKHLDIGTLYLTGGEPLLYRGIHDVLSAAAQVPELQITLCTNATLLAPRHAAFLSEIGARANVSIDGEQAFHDYFRQLPGAFSAAEMGLRNLAEAGVPVTIVTTIIQANLLSLGSIAEWAVRSGAVEFRV